jgi:hypothetical protein
MLQLGNKITVGEPVYKFQNNHSVDFDGVDDFIQLRQPISYTEHSISTWVKVSDTGASKTIIDARDANDDGIRIFVTSAEVVTYQLNTSDINSGSAISVDEWHHIVATYDGTTQKLYIDGSLADSTATSQTIITTTNAKIGARNFSDRANEFAGKIDELAIYDRALTEEEVTKIFRIKYGANLVLNGRLDELGSELANFSDSNIVFNNLSDSTTISLGNNSYRSEGFGNTNDARPRVQINGSDIVTGKTYKVTYTPTAFTGSTVFDFFENGTRIVNNHDASVSKTFYFVASDSTDGFDFDGSQTFRSDYILSVKQVDPNDRFALGTGWEINASGLVYTGTTNANAEQEGILTSGKVYKLTYNVVTSTIDGNVKLMSETVSGTVALEKSVGTHTQLITANGSNGTDFGIRITGNTTGTYIIDNLMVEEQKYVATNLKLNSIPYSSSNLRNYYRFGDGILDTHPLICDMVQPSLGSNLVLNGTFETAVTTDEWTNFNTPTTSERSTTYAYEGNFSYHIVSDAGNEGIFATANQFNGDYAVGDIVKVQAFVYPITASSNQMKSGLNNSDRAFNTTVTGLTLNQWNQIEYYVRIVTATNNYLTFLSEGAGNEFYLDNVSTQVVNGVPGLMTNMTEEDITNDVPS